MLNLISSSYWHNKRDKADIVLWLEDNDEGQAPQLDLCPAPPLYQPWKRVRQHAASVTLKPR
jgi:hypothetical protein